jgi:hypothetical protein
VIVPSDSSNVLKDFGKRKVSETVSIPSHAPSMSDGEASTSSAPFVDTVNKTILNVVSEVAHALAPEEMESEPSNTQVDPAFRKFV